MIKLKNIETEIVHLSKIHSDLDFQHEVDFSIQKLINARRRELLDEIDKIESKEKLFDGKRHLTIAALSSLSSER